MRIAGQTETSIDLYVAACGTVTAAIKLSAQPGKVSDLPRESAPPQVWTHPRDLPFEQMSGQRGAVTAPASEDEIRNLFPALANAIGAAGDQACWQRRRSSACHVPDCTRCLPASTSISTRVRISATPSPTQCQDRCALPLAADRYRRLRCDRPAGGLRAPAAAGPGRDAAVYARVSAGRSPIRDRWSSAAPGASARSPRRSSPPAAGIPSSPTGTARRKPMTSRAKSAGWRFLRDPRYDALLPATEQLRHCRGRLLLLFRDAENLPAQVAALRSR